MKTFKKIALKAAAVCMAVVTTLSMVLNPLPLNAFDYTAYFDRGIEGDNYFVNEWDMEEGITEGSRGRCGYRSYTEPCMIIIVTANNKYGGGYGQFPPFSAGGYGGGGTTFSQQYAFRTICGEGNSITCSEKDTCTGIQTTYQCNPNCSVTIRETIGKGL